MVWLGRGVRLLLWFKIFRERESLTSLAKPLQLFPRRRDGRKLASEAKSLGTRAENPVIFSHTCRVPRVKPAASPWADNSSPRRWEQLGLGSLVGRNATGTMFRSHPYQSRRGDLADGNKNLEIPHYRPGNQCPMFRF